MPLSQAVAFPYRIVMNIRNSALLASVAGVLGNALPAWNSSRSLLETVSRSGTAGRWFIPLVIFAYLFTAIMPVLYFALYRNKGTLRISDGLRRLCLIAALTLGTMMAMAVANWTGSLRPSIAAMRAIDWKTGAASVLTASGDPRTIQNLSFFLNLIGQIGVIMLLAALFRERQEASTADIPISRLLAVLARAAAIGWGLWLAFEIVRLALTPYSYFQLQQYASQIGRTPPRLWDMMARMISEVMETACLWVVPFVICKRHENQRDSETTPAASE